MGQGPTWSAERRQSYDAKTPTPLERLMAGVEYDPFGGCWLWPGSPRNGYGTIRVNSRTHLAHRLSYELHVGSIPDGLRVCHKCDVRACFNPAHLFLGTDRDNILDCNAKGRRPYARGSRHHMSSLCEAQVTDILRRLCSGEAQSAVAESYGIARSVVSKIALGTSWRHVPGERPPPTPNPRGVAAIGVAKTHCVNGHPFDEGNTAYNRGGTHRRCRQCARDATRAYKRRLKAASR